MSSTTMSSTTTFGGPGPATAASPEELGAALVPVRPIRATVNGLIWATLTAGSIAAWYVVIRLALELTG